jgi:hypothetical protein
MTEGDRMTFSKRTITRREAITAAVGTLAAGYPLSLQAAEPTGEERANTQVVKNFCEAWPTHDVGKINVLLRG